VMKQTVKKQVLIYWRLRRTGTPVCRQNGGRRRK